MTKSHISTRMKSGIKRFNLSNHWTARELINIGIFAAVIKASSFLVAILGGGMNPLSLAAKNCLFIMFMLVLLHKVPRMGTLTLAMLVTMLVSFLLMGQRVLNIPATFAVCLVAEAVIFLLGGYGKSLALLIGLFVLEVGTKAVSMGLIYVSMREQPGMILSAAVITIIGCIGSFAGLYCGMRLTKELRHAGVISA